MSILVILQIVPLFFENSLFPSEFTIVLKMTINEIDRDQVLLLKVCVCVSAHTSVLYSQRAKNWGLQTGNKYKLEQENFAN